MPTKRQVLVAHLELDGEGIDEILRNAVGVAPGVHTHGDELALPQNNNTVKHHCATHTQPT